MLELGVRLAGVFHAPRRINDEVCLEIGFLFILLDVIPVGLAVGAPVDMSDLVARAVLPMLGELHRKPLEGALVQTRHHPFNHEPREQFEPAETGQRGGVEFGFLGDRHFWQNLGECNGIHGCLRTNDRKTPRSIRQAFPEETRTR